MHSADSPADFLYKPAGAGAVLAGRLADAEFVILKQQLRAVYSAGRARQWR
jgi:hypothetical protein